MGSHTLAMTLDGKLSTEKVEKFVDDAAEEARNEFQGEQEDLGYSGDWNTIQGVRFLNAVFDTRQEAQDFCERTAQKYGPAVAVKFKAFDPAKSKRLMTVKQQIRELSDKSYREARTMTPKQQASLKSKIDTLRNRVVEYEKALAAKSNKFTWLVLGWAAS